MQVRSSQSIGYVVCAAVTDSVLMINVRHGRATSPAFEKEWLNRRLHPTVYLQNLFKHNIWLDMGTFYKEKKIGKGYWVKIKNQECDLMITYAVRMYITYVRAHKYGIRTRFI